MILNSGECFSSLDKSYSTKKCQFFVAMCYFEIYTGQKKNWINEREIKNTAVRHEKSKWLFDYDIGIAMVTSFKQSISYTVLMKRTSHMSV